MKLHWGICEWEGKNKLWESSEQYVRVPCGLVAPWWLGRLECQELPLGHTGQGFDSWPLSPAREQGRQPGGSRSLGHQAWVWGWNKARTGHQPSGRDPGQDHHGYSNKAKKCGSQKKEVGSDGDSSQCCLSGSLLSPLISEWLGVALSCTTAKLALRSRQPNLQEKEGCGQGPYVALSFNNLSKHYLTRSAGLLSGGFAIQMPTLQQIQVCSDTRMDMLCMASILLLLPKWDNKEPWNIWFTVS